ncbi:MAG: ZIP family metal transporter [Cyclobacteriaceae bacterium]|nr:ZIP family metal transporter [Cyclobacteriaceae bacterium]
MTADVLILFAVALAAGMLAFYIPNVSKGFYKLALVFAGAYLFSITIIHVLPELFHDAVNPGLLGIFTLGGFFLQQGLEFASQGVEHGHIHVHDHAHRHRESSAVLVVAALSLHSLLEGGMLNQSAMTDGNSSQTLLLGILIHKAPEAFALMSVLVCELEKKRRAFLYLMVFAMATPAGILLGNYLTINAWLSSESYMLLVALVSGNFLHISTTIVFESSADHTFNARKMGVAMGAAALAVIAEILM